jgi:hypothetical protein
VVSSLESFKNASAKINAIKTLTAIGQSVFHCKRCLRDIFWDQVYFGARNGLPYCRVHGVRVKVGSGDSLRLRDGGFRICRKPYPICDCQLLAVRDYKPVIFCMSLERCLKVVLLDSPKKHNPAIASEQLRKNKGAS